MQELKKMEKNLQKTYLAYYNSLIAQNFWQAHQILSIIHRIHRIHRIKCKYGHDDKKCETCGIKYKCCDCFLEYMNFKDNLIECKMFML